MWNLKVRFNKLEEVGELINKIRNIKKVEYHVSKDNNEILLSGDNEFSHELTIEAISEIIVGIYKNKYFFENINLKFLQNDLKEALIKALILFDIESDIYYVLCLIENLSTIVVPSFNMFKLSKLRLKWQEFVYVTNLNSDYLINKEIFVEFLKFLINSIQPKTKEINLKSDLSNFLFFDEKGHLIKNSIDIKDEMGLITNLVMLAPRNINIHCSDKVSDKTCKTLYYLFNNKINLLV